MCKISVILPCYNGARLIGRAIESVLAQSCKHFELIIVDDGSTDNSQEIIASYLCDKRIRYIYQKNSGFSATINRGIAASNGCLIGFIGQDDLWVTNKLELQVKHFSKHKDVALIYSNYYSIDLEDRIIGMVNQKVHAFPSKQALIKQLFQNNFIGFETVLVQRKCFDSVGLFDERMAGFSDHDMWLRIAGLFEIAYLDLFLVKKREHELQLSKTNDVLKDRFLLVINATDRFPFLKELERKKLASLYYSWGITLLQKGNTEEGKQKLLKAIKCQPWKVKSTIAYIAPSLYAFILHHYQEFAQVHTSLSWVES